MFGYYAEFIVFLHFILLFFYFLHYFATLAIWYWIAIKCLFLCLSTTTAMVVVEGLACLPALTIVRRHHLCNEPNVNRHRCYRWEWVRPQVWIQIITLPRVERGIWYWQNGSPYDVFKKLNRQWIAGVDPLQNSNYLWKSRVYHYLFEKVYKKGPPHHRIFWIFALNVVLAQFQASSSALRLQE